MGTYYAASGAGGSWSGAQNIATPCSLSTALYNAIAGDTVYLRGGTYPFSGTWQEAFKPTNSGTGAANRIVFAAYPTEIPLLSGSGTTASYGLVLGAKSYIKIDGIRFKNFYWWGTIYASSHHNEIARCWFYSDTGEDVTFGLRIAGGCVGGASQTCPSTHNWVHHNVLFNLHESQTTYILNEGSDAICIGSDNDIYGDDNNTIENNFVYHAGHTCFDGYGLYTVVKNNVFHNEPFWDDDSVGKSTTLTGDIGTGDTTINVVSTAALAQEDFYWGYLLIGSERISYSSRTATSFTGCTRGISGTTAAAHSSGATVSPYARYRPDMYTNEAYRGKFSHRCFQITDGGTREGIYALVEGNRMGHAGANPNNNGADGLDIAGPRTIVRFNSIYNNMHAGVMFKYGWTPYGGSNGGCYTKFYNNTVYKSGYGNPRYEIEDDGVSTSPESLLAIRFYTSEYTLGNVLKNNLIYDSRRYALSGFDMGYGSSSPGSPTGTVLESNWWTSNGDPLFTNPDVSDPTSQTLPNLTLQAASGCIRAGTFLTRANGPGTTSVLLTVDDAAYFQDGSWGSDLARGVTMFPDWIAIGTVSNVVEIEAINYGTNVITLASPMTWADDAPIWLYKNSDGTRVLYGSSPDLGAHPYEGTGVSNTELVMASAAFALASSVPTLSPQADSTLVVDSPALAVECDTLELAAAGTMPWDIRLGPLDHESLLPPLNWQVGGSPEMPAGKVAYVDSVKLADGSVRHNFRTYAPRKWTLAWARLGAADVQALNNLKALNQPLHYQNRWLGEEWHWVIITNCDPVPLTATLTAGTAFYKVTMELEEVI